MQRLALHVPDRAFQGSAWNRVEEYEMLSLVRCVVLEMHAAFRLW